MGNTYAKSRLRDLNWTVIIGENEIDRALSSVMPIGLRQCIKLSIPYRTLIHANDRKFYEESELNAEVIFSRMLNKYVRHTIVKFTKRFGNFEFTSQYEEEYCYFNILLYWNHILYGKKDYAVPPMDAISFGEFHNIIYDFALTLRPKAVDEYLTHILTDLFPIKKPKSVYSPQYDVEEVINYFKKLLVADKNMSSEIKRSTMIGKVNALFYSRMINVMPAEYRDIYKKITDNIKSYRERAVV